jgi:drug/metabolite transporter (DMT)-like permease
MKHLWTNLGLLMLVNALWATIYFANKWVGLGPVATSVWSFLIAIPVLAPFVWLERHAENRAFEPVMLRTAERSLLRRENIVGFAMAGVLGLLPAAGFMAWGERYTSASNAALLGLSVPVMTPLLAWLVLRERMGKNRWFGLAIALAGAAVLSTGAAADDPATGGGPGNFWRALAGNCLVLLSCASSCFYNVFSKELLRRFSPLEVLLGGYTLALAVSLPLLFWLEPVSLPDIAAYTVQRWMGLLILGVLVWGAGMVLWLRVLSRLDVSLASISIYLLPFFGVLFSIVLLGERLTGRVLFGGLIALVGATVGLWPEPGRLDANSGERVA